LKLAVRIEYNFIKYRKNYKSN